MQLHALLVSCFIADAPISSTCWSARLATSVLNLLCLHSKYSIIIVAIAKIIAAVNTNMSTMRLFAKKNFRRFYIYIMPFFQIKISFFCLYCEIYSLQVWGADNRVSSNLVSLRKIGSVCLDMVLLVSFCEIKLVYIVYKGCIQCKIHNQIRISIMTCS